MDWINTVEDIFQRNSSQAGGAATAPANPHEDFQQVAQTAPPNVVSSGIAQAFRSDRTPPFPEMLANLFGQSDPMQLAEVINRLLGEGRFTPEQANRVSPDQVKEMAAQAEKQHPSVVDEVSSFYAQHPEVMKAAGGLALTIALQHILQRR